jgi:hypothetical protein
MSYESGKEVECLLDAMKVITAAASQDYLHLALLCFI